MNNNIYVNDNNVIYNYEVSFNKEEFEKIIDEIDVWYDKGELKAFVGYVCPECPGRKTDIFAQVDLEDDKKEFFYYQYIQHPLARLATAILSNNDVFASSRLIQFLATWNYESEEEKIFVIKLMSCFEFDRVNLGDAYVIDITEEDKRGFFERVVDAFKKKERERFIVAGSSKFHEELDMTIGKEEDKKYAKRRYVLSLPKSKDINK